MIYMVEIDFTSPAHEGEWNDWYFNHLPTLLSVPGIDTAQRLKATAGASPAYIAIYTVAAPEVYTSDAYRGVGGGGDASAKWRAFIKRRRNLFAGLDRVPAISDDARLIVTELEPADLDLPDLMFLPLAVAALDGAPTRRHLAVVDAARAERQDVASLAGLRVYRPISKRHLSAR